MRRSLVESERDAGSPTPRLTGTRSAAADPQMHALPRSVREHITRLHRGVALPERRRRMRPRRSPNWQTEAKSPRREIRAVPANPARPSLRISARQLTGVPATRHGDFHRAISRTIRPGSPKTLTLGRRKRPSTGRFPESSHFSRLKSPRNSSPFANAAMNAAVRKRRFRYSRKSSPFMSTG
jgi:hypothetical protein